MSNWINLGILIVTGLVGLLAWYGARKSAKEARKDQEEAKRAAIRSASAAEKSNDIQRKILSIEESRQADVAMEAKKATLTARIDRTRSRSNSGQISKSYFLVIKNSGSAVARDLVININGVSVDDHGNVITPKNYSELYIGPDSEIRLTLIIGRALPLPINVDIAWGDDSAIRGHWEGDLT